MPVPTRIIGIDPGSRLAGYGIIEKVGQQLIHVDHGVIDVRSEGELPQRLLRLFKDLTAVLQQHQPQAAALEQVFVQINAKTALVLGQARGVALLAMANQGLSAQEYLPNLVKKTVTGAGHADKIQMQTMAKLLLKLPELPQVDAADALCIAICHAHHLGNPLQPTVVKASKGRRSGGRGLRWAALPVLGEPK